LNLVCRALVVLTLLGGVALRSADLHQHDPLTHHEARCTACRVLDTPLAAPACVLDVGAAPRPPAARPPLPPALRPDEPATLGAWSLRGPPPA
jgi:hypothetical protein